LEASMTVATETLAVAMVEAARPGEAYSPTALLACVSQEADPLNALLDDNRANEIYAAIQGEFQFLQVLRGSNRPLSAENMTKLIELLRWIIVGFREWQAEADPARHLLAALFVAARICEQAETFWEMFPVGLETNVGLIDEMARLVGGRSATLAAVPWSRSPIHDADIITQLAGADASADFERIGSCWSLLEAGFFPDTVATTSVQSLARFAFDRLVDATAAIHQTIVAMGVAAPLSRECCLALGVGTTSAHMQFAAAYWSLSHRHGNPDPLSAAEDASLVGLLSLVAAVPESWPRWMAVFNRFPVRYPELQVPLGRALATAGESAVQDYVGAILLQQNIESRKAVAECLRSFRAIAPLERRQRLWSLCLKRWSNWRWGAPEGGHLMQVGYCELDYGVVGYALECMDAVGRSAELVSIQERLRHTDERWFGSGLELKTEWNGLLSELQPFAHADMVARDGGDWLMEGMYHLPEALRDEPYFKLRCGDGSSPLGKR
jgi:hypothetical protein